MSWLRIQTPTLRLQVAVDAGAVGDVAAALRAEHGFPDDWHTRPEWDCAVSAEPVHPDYWRSLADTLHELRLCRGESDHLTRRLRASDAELARLRDTLARLTRQSETTRTVVDLVGDLRVLVDQLRPGGTTP